MGEAWIIFSWHCQEGLPRVTHLVPSEGRVIEPCQEGPAPGMASSVCGCLLGQSHISRGHQSGSCGPMCARVKR